MTSKYATMREEEGHCKHFLKQTADYHDKTMQHPLMQSIYDTRVTDEAYVHYLRCLRTIFKELETEHAMESLPRALLDLRLLRCSAIDADLESFGIRDEGNRWHSPAIQQYFAELLQTPQVRDSETLTCHHFLHYNAILSGGMFLGGCLKKMGKSTELYAFDLRDSAGNAVKCHQYVRDYMQRLDGIDGLDRPKMVAIMRRIYELTEDIMDEAQALQPEVIRAPSESRRPESTAVAAEQDFSRDISLRELHQSDGVHNGPTVWVSIGGRVLDVSSSQSYTPDGPYGLFAGHDISRCLGEMSLEERDLDDLSYDAPSACTTWATRLGLVYPAVGTLVDFDPSKRLPTSIFAYDANAPPLDEVGGSASNGPETRGGGTQDAGNDLAVDNTCPLTGQKGDRCPLGFGSGSGATEAKISTSGGGEPDKGLSESDLEVLRRTSCPFPFIFMHDPRLGWQLYRQRAIDWVSGVLIGCAVGVLAMWVAMTDLREMHDFGADEGEVTKKEDVVYPDVYMDDFGEPTIRYLKDR